MQITSDSIIVLSGARCFRIEPVNVVKSPFSILLPRPLRLGGEILISPFA